ncbi:hypothetical protein [Paraburkholderia ginsengiterrae]|uniref:hypothetical protein n=1 Tax=Paraburkholderia ginsengiterrae TaxID=1462993 RepID=UPI00104239ED|nr:hypothetical protein [Paraburkholderia ginsengiterrae]
MFIASPNNERRRRRNGVHTTAEYTRPLFEKGHPLSADVGQERTSVNTSQIVDDLPLPERGTRPATLSSQFLKEPETCDYTHGQQNNQSRKRRDQHKSPAEDDTVSHGMPWLEEAVIREQVKQCTPDNECDENPDANCKRVQCGFLNRAHLAFVVLSHW